MNRLVLLVTAVVFTFASPWTTAASAAMVLTPYNFDTVLDNTSLTFDRPADLSTLAGTPDYAYESLTFTPDTDGDYTFTATSAILTIIANDTFYLLYTGSFDPATPLANLTSFDDDGGAGAPGLSEFTAPLLAGTSYTFVATTFLNGDSGTISNQIAGPAGSSLDIAAVPEPSSLALIGIVAAAGLRSVRWRKL